MNKLKIKFGKDESGRITHGKIISERNEQQNNQSLPRESSVGSYQLPLNPDDAFHGFPDASVPDWVSEDFTGVDLKSKFHIKPTLSVTINSKNYQTRRRGVAAPVSVKTSDPPVEEAPSLKREGHFEIPKLVMALPSQSPLSRKKLCKREPFENFEIEVEFKAAPVKCSTRRKSRSEKACLLSSNISSSNSHMPDSETDMVCTEPEIPPLFLAAAMDDWVEDEISLAEESLPLGETKSISPVSVRPASSPLSSPPTSSVTDNILLNLPAGGGTSLVPSFSTKQNVPAVLQQSNLVSTEVSSDTNVSNKGHSPGMVTGSEGPRASVIVKNPSQIAKYQVSSDQSLDRVRDDSSEVIDLTDVSEDNSDVKTDISSPQLVILQRSGCMSPTKVGRRPSSSTGRSSISYSGVEINLVIPSNNNHNTELKIKLNQNQVEELKNCLKEV